MTLAVLLTVDRPVGHARVTRLTDQLAAAGAREVRVLDADPAGQLREVARLAGTATEPLLLCSGDLVANTAALFTLVTEPGGSVALVGPPAAGIPGVREDRGILVAVTPPVGGGSFRGALRVGVPHLRQLAERARRLADEPAPDAAVPAGPAGLPSSGLGPGDALDTLLADLVGSGIRVGACRTRLLFAGRVEDEPAAAAAEAAAAAVDERQARLRMAVKEHDDLFATYFVSPLSPYLVRAADRLGLSPTGVTAISVAVAGAAAGCFATGARLALVAGALLLYLSFLLDCVDGQLARYRRTFSSFGAWLDTMADRTKEYLVYAGLAVGADRAGLDFAWWLAIGAIILQTVRHATDAWYGALHDAATARKLAAGPQAGAAGGIGSRLTVISERAQGRTGSFTYWFKRTVVFPIGERWALIGITAALFNGRAALIAVLVWGALAAAYTLCLRSLRAWSMRVSALAGGDLPAHRDDGPLAAGVLGAVGGGRLPPLPLAVLAAAGQVVLLAAAAFGVPALDGPAWVWTAAAAAVALLAALAARSAHGGPLDWLVPATLRATEFLFAVNLAVVYDVPKPWLYALLFALALLHYDGTARMEKRIGANPLRAAALGWDGRIALLAIIGPVTVHGSWLVAVWVSGVVLVGAFVTWGRRPQPPPAIGSEPEGAIGARR